MVLMGQKVGWGGDHGGSGGGGGVLSGVREGKAGMRWGNECQPQQLGLEPQ